MSELFPRLGIAEEMSKLEQYMRGLLASPVLLLSQPARHILTAGGKRLRSVLVFVSARAAGGSMGKSQGTPLLAAGWNGRASAARGVSWYRLFPWNPP